MYSNSFVALVKLYRILTFEKNRLQTVFEKKKWKTFFWKQADYTAYMSSQLDS